MTVEKLSAGRIRGAANTLVRAWQEAGSDYARYDTVWEAKEYLHNLADALEARP